MVRLVVSAARFSGMGLLGCCGPDGGPWCLHFSVLLSGRWAVRVQSIAKGAWKDFRDGAVVPFK